MVERIVEVPKVKIVYVEKPVEVEKIVYNDVITEVEKIVFVDPNCT